MLLRWLVAAAVLLGAARLVRGDDGVLDVAVVDAQQLGAVAPGDAAGGSRSRLLQSSSAAYWKPFPWGACSVPCGGGTQTRLVVCWGACGARTTDAARSSRATAARVSGARTSRTAP